MRKFINGEELRHTKYLLFFEKLFLKQDQNKNTHGNG
jgi:hypothetical protein